MPETYYQKNREKLLAYQNEYYRSNQTKTPEYREKRKQYMKEYRARNKLSLRQLCEDHSDCNQLNTLEKQE